MPTTSFELAPRGPYSLAASAAFLMEFTPAAGTAAGDAGALSFGFGLDRTYQPVAVRVHQDGDRVVGRAVGTADAGAVARQVARVLSLDHDGRAYPEVGVRDPVIGGLQDRFGGLRPVCFYSPYEAAAWAVLATRTPMAVAARTRARLAAALGEARTIDGATFHVFPAPARLAELDGFAGLSDEKLARLRGIARAALDGWLDADRLRATDYDVARTRLRALRGVGAWTAAHVLLRGACLVDRPAFDEPRVRRGFELAYDLGREATADELAAAAERWRPFRTWVSVLLAVLLARSGRWHERGAGRGRGR